MLNTISTKAYIATTEALRSGIQRFARDERGVTAIEYGLIAVAVAALIIAVFYNKAGFIHKLQDKFGELTSAISSTNANLAVE
ncbi:Flp family type IVb pilin [Actinobacillus delphinicola]|uniref:Flp operon protein Flp1 n=1 Tax=Actinobacillus delphinicola TaxID=51161 RepID=A0A448TW98_9PAST|nr:Flp family type IVb pilin [Actinobacillus delphinicola]VEJ10204.1 flp operon protein Flp1 [Actinobacillus delphinicola]